ncbi:YczE/YyaS/YitT family protein [Arthrobacter sp. YN]|uniref:YczE/YyaS/YitT family protein n=1 Tax=Arthrobacter sp. YN TaxID=2020486 RepID=UPI0026D40C5C
MLVRRITQLLAGLSLFGFSIAVLIKAGLGISPWDIFHQGLGRLTGISTGMVIIAVSFLVLLLWIPLRMRPGWGTLANAVLIGAFVDLSIPLIPQANGLLWQVVYLAGGWCSWPSAAPPTLGPPSAQVHGTG